MDPLFLVQSNKFSSDNVPTTLVCPQCEEAFKRFPTTPRWTDIKFRCPVCDGSDEEDLPFRVLKTRNESMRSCKN